VCRPEGRQRPKAPESSLVTAARGFYTFRRAEPSLALPAGPVAPRKAFRFPTLGFPGLPSAAASPEGCCGLGAHGGGPRPLRLPRGLQQRVVSPDVLSFSTSQWPAIHRAQCPQQPRWYASGWLKDLVPATRVIPDASRGSPITNFLFRGFVRTPARRGSHSGRLSRSGTEVRAAALSNPFGPGCFAPLSYTLRGCFSPPHARPGSWATFYFPQNSFVWEILKMCSRPPNRKTISHRFSQE
jgi:hypothetical protein